MDTNEAIEKDQASSLRLSPGKSIERPGIDIKGALDRLKVTIEIYKRSLKFFVKRYPDFIEEVKSALGKNEPNEARKLLHTLRGSAINLGANEVKEFATKLGSAIKDGKDDLESLINDLEIALNTALESMKSFIRERNDGQ